MELQRFSKRYSMPLFVVFVLFLSVSVFDIDLLADDWPIWRGPDLNGISKEVISTEHWPAGKAEIVWRASVGAGFSSMTVSDGKLYTMGNTGKKGVDESGHMDVVYCFDAETGNQVWKYSYQHPLDPKYYVGGTSATPIVSSGKVYTVSKHGKAFCLDAKTGKVVWSKDLVKDFGIQLPTWGLAGSPFILENMVIYNAGSLGIALNKDDGSKIWQNGSGTGGYSTVVLFGSDKQKCIAIFGEKTIAGLEASTGKKLWEHPWETKHNVNAADPVFSGDKVFISSGYEKGCALLKLDGNNVTELWRNDVFRCKMNGPVLKDGYLYGVDETNQVKCVKFDTGELVWSQKGLGYGTLTIAGDKLVILGEEGQLVIARATTDGLKAISKAKVLPSGTCWAVPVVANGKIYARNSKGDVVCVDVKGKASSAASVPASNWPQWKGPDRDGISKETGLLKSWPKDGPELLWSAQGLGKGFSTVSIDNGTIYVTGMKDDTEHLSAFDLKGNLKWQKPYGKGWTKSFPSARSTPTIDSGNVYVMTTLGTVACLDAKTGENKWSVDTKEKFGAKLGRWGGAESVLIEGSKLICTPGGDSASLVALDKNNGKTIWTTKELSQQNAYCSPLIIERGNKKIVVTLIDKVVVGVDADNGSLLWKYDCEKYMGDMRIRANHPNTPIYKDGHIYITSGYDMGGVKLKISDDGMEVSQLWSDKNLDTHHGSVVLVDGFIYGSNWQSNDNGSWVCLDWNSGQKKYETQWNTKGSIAYAEGMLYCYDEKKGNVALVKASPEKFEVISSFQVTEGADQHWAHPVIFDGKLFIRHGDALMVYNIKQS